MATAPAAEGDPTTAPADESEVEPFDPAMITAYDPDPPFPVQLVVRDPETDEQPGWLRIMELTEGANLAATRGSFPEANRINVDTNNVQRLRIHIGHLPLEPNRRIVLRIDGHNMEIVRRGREYIHLDRRPTGVWEVVPEPAQEP